MNIPIRRIGIDAFASLRLTSFRCTPGAGDAEAVEAAICGLTPEELTDNGGCLFAAHDGHLTVGVAVVMPIASRPEAWTIPMLAVRLPWQGAGVGRDLKMACLTAAHEAGAHKVISSVHTATGRMHRINQTTPGAEWAAEVTGPGVLYSIDLAGWAKVHQPGERLPIDLPPKGVAPRRE